MTPSTAVRTKFDIGCLINGAGTPEQRELDTIAKADGLKAALAWRNSRYQNG